MSHGKSILADAQTQTIAAVVASRLPMTLQDVDAKSIAVLSGAARWPQRVAESVSAGTLVSLVIGPEPVQVAELEDIAGAQVLFGWRFLSDPALDALQDWQSRTGVLAMTMTIGLLDSIDAAVLEIRMMLSRRGIDLGNAIQRTPGGARGSIRTMHADDALVVIVVVQRTEAHLPELYLEWTEVRRRLRVHVTSDATARPATIELTDAHGARLLATNYESSHRRTMLRAIDMTRASTWSSELEELRAVLRSSPQELAP